MTDLYFPSNPTFEMKNFVNDGFERVCDVDVSSRRYEWMFVNVNSDLMWADHNSWVYFIVVNGVIFKCGESGNPIGIKGSLVVNGTRQPLRSTKCRFGRLSTGDGTDAYLRESLDPYLKQNIKIEIWAKKCPIYYIEEKINGKKTQIPTTIHKSLEQMYLAYFSNKTGNLPWFNKAHK